VQIQIQTIDVTNPSDVRLFFLVPWLALWDLHIITDFALSSRNLMLVRGGGVVGTLNLDIPEL